MWAIFAFFLGKRPLRWNFQNSVPKVFTALPIDVVVFKCRKICPTGNRLNRALFIWPRTFSLLLKLLATARILAQSPKICQGQPSTMRSQCSRFHSNRLTFGGLIADAWTPFFAPYRVFPWFTRYASLRSNNYLRQLSFLLCLVLGSCRCRCNVIPFSRQDKMTDQHLWKVLKITNWEMCRFALRSHV